MDDQALLPARFRDPLLKIKGGTAIWLVGGAVRDHFLRRQIRDYDFVIGGDALALARRLANALRGDFYVLDGERGTGRVLWTDGEGQRWILDFASLREADIRDDLRRRDFTINAMAVRLDSTALIDPTGGLPDLREGLLRLCREDAMLADPVRALRAVRLAVELGFHVDQEAIRAIREVASAMSSLSPERLRDELFRTLDLRNPSPAVRSCASLDLWSGIQAAIASFAGSPFSWPECEARATLLDRIARMLAVLGPEHDEEAAAEATLALLPMRLGRFRRAFNDYLNHELVLGRNQRGMMMFALLFSGAFGASRESTPANTSAEVIGEALRLSRRELAWLKGFESGLRALRGRSGGEERIWLHRYFQRAGEAGIGAGLAHGAETLSERPGPPDQALWAERIGLIRALMEAYFERQGEWINPAPLLDGDEVIRILGIPPGPEVGDVLHRLIEAQVRGEVRSRGEAEAFIRQLPTEKS